MSKSSKNLSNMLCLDIYLSSLSEKEQAKISRKIEPIAIPHPLLSGDIYSAYANQLTIEEKKKNDLQALLHFQKKANWAVDLSEILRADYFTLVLTDANQTIQWANKSFTSMTGYPINYAVGRSPRFLQGEKTSEEIKKQIKQKLVLKKPFTETVINYRKNQELYLCKVTFFPLLNQQQEVTHFLALESEMPI
jgi:PAS domain S-box-containing protein